LPESFAFLGQGMIGLVPVPVIFMLVITIVIAYLLENTPFGRNIYAVGGNSIAAKLAGIKVENVTLYVYMLSGMFASLSGLLLTSRMNAGQPTIGASWVMPSITAAIIGGTSLSGGEGTIIGTIIGAAFMGVLANGIVLLNISSYWERVITGAVVIIAVVIDLIRKIRSQKE
jgi:ribose transport system permease protein